MKIYYWMEHPEEYTEVPQSENNKLGLELNKNSSEKAIQALFHFIVIAEDDTGKIQYNAKALSEKMIEKFKSSKCYEEKPEAETEGIIKY